MRALPHSPAKPYLSLYGFLIAVMVGAGLAMPAAAQEHAPSVVAASRPLITQALDETQLTVLKGNTHGLARPEFDLGRAPATLPMQRMLLVLKRSDEQEAALRKLLDDQHDKHSANYHKWLTPEQFGAQFGPRDADLQIITSWLESHGFQVGTTKGRTLLEFSGSASQVQQAFHTPIHKYIVNGEQHWANASDPSIPSALTPAVAGVKTLHNFLKKPMVHLADKYIPAKLNAKSQPEFTSSTGMHALTPSDYQTIYNATPTLNRGITGAGVTVAVVGRSNLFNGGEDVTEFRSVFGLSGPGVSIVLNGPDPGDSGNTEELEATLDASWSGAVSPGANIDFVVSGSTNTTDGIDLSELYIIENNLGQIMTESFGTCETNPNIDLAATGLLAEQAAAQGITYMVSTGDTGAEGCDDLGETTATGGISVNGLASTPFTVAVGGTLFNENTQDSTYWNTTNNNTLGSAVKYIPEDVWNETCTTTCTSGQPPLAAGGGGTSVYFTTKPSWQTGFGDTARDIPDVSLTSAGHDFYLLCLEASCVPDSQGFISFAGVLGTSAAAPSFASIMALVDQSQGGAQGVANYVLYPLALQQEQKNPPIVCDASSTTTPPNSACVFNDVTSGNNSVPGEAGYPNGVYSAAAGYDLATGLGSVNIDNLVTAWHNATFHATSTTLTLNGATTPITITHGDTVTVAVTVTSNSGTPTGDIALIGNPFQGVPPAAGFGSQVFKLVGGSASGTTTELRGGDYTVSAQYPGDGTYASSTSSPSIPVSVKAENSTMTISGFDPNNLPLTGGTYPFGSLIFVRADVFSTAAGSPCQTPRVKACPTGMVTFTDSAAAIPTLNPQIIPPVTVLNPSPLNSEGNTSIGDGIISFDAGNHSITASYAGDLSFNSSSATTPVAFTIQPGFAGVSGPTSVSISSPGLSGTTTVGIVASTGFSTSITFTCSGLPAETTCSSASATGQGPTNIVNTNIVVTTTAAHTTMLHSSEPRYYYAVLLGGGLPLAGLFLIGGPQRRRWSTLLGLMLLMAFLVAVPGCGGGGGSHHTQDPGTPAGSYVVTLTATAGSLSEQASFNLTVQ